MILYIVYFFGHEINAPKMKISKCAAHRYISLRKACQYLLLLTSHLLYQLGWQGSHKTYLLWGSGVVVPQRKCLWWSLLGLRLGCFFVVWFCDLIIYKIQKMHKSYLNICIFMHIHSAWEYMVLILVCTSIRNMHPHVGTWYVSRWSLEWFLFFFAVIVTYNCNGWYDGCFRNILSKIPTTNLRYPQ